jgi:hypothetical protein
MKTKLIVVLATAAVLSACSSTKLAGIDPGNVNPLKDQRLSTDFKRDGIKVTYTFSGEVEKIEAYGYAEVWRGQYRIVAEADAKDKLIKFLRGESVETSRMTKVISKSLEKSQDHTVNKYRSADGTINTVAEDVEKEADVVEATDADSGEQDSKENTAIRKAAVNNAMTITSTITVQSRGKLSAVYKEAGGTVDDGKTYMAVYAWSPKNQKAARQITNLMDNVK